MESSALSVSIPLCEHKSTSKSSIAPSQVDSARRVCRIAVAADQKFKRYGSLNAVMVKVTLRPWVSEFSESSGGRGLISSQGIVDPHVSRLAKCGRNDRHEKNQRRNLHNMLEQAGRQLDIRISYCKCPVRVVQGATVKKKTVDWPVIYFSQWLRCALKHGGKLVLCGHEATATHLWQQEFQQFWDRYQQYDPTHPIYDLDPGKRKFFLPFTVHGDEGRGKNKNPTLIENFCPVITYKGPKVTNLSGYLNSIAILFFVWEATHVV